MYIVVAIKNTILPICETIIDHFEALNSILLFNTSVVP